jgi:hypothetical protein
MGMHFRVLSTEDTGMHEELPTRGSETRRTIGTVKTEMRDSRFKIPYPEMTVRRKVTSTHFVLFVK